MKRVIPLLAMSAHLLAACKSEPTCDYSKAPYMNATSIAPLQAPEGLSAPDRSAALVIPPPPASGAALPTGKGKCLDRPPSYFSTQHADGASDKKTEK